MNDDKTELGSPLVGADFEKSLAKPNPPVRGSISVNNQPKLEKDVIHKYDSSEMVSLVDDEDDASNTLT